MKQKRFILWSLMVFVALANASAGIIKGNIKDKNTKEPLIGATVQILGTTVGTVTDFDGNYQLPVLAKGVYSIQVQYVAYKTILLKEIKVADNNQEAVLDFDMESNAQELGEVVVTARKNMENEKMLMLERKAASVAIENMGAKEMALKGVSNVADGVKKLTGISLADAGQLVVRGLGDRYSTTTLNGLPIASPNPDNKLIPLDLFPTSTVKNITVSKVYEVSSFADYSGAHVDVGTRENTGKDFLTVTFNIGGNSNAIFKDFYKSNRKGSLLSTPSLDPKVRDMNRIDFTNYTKSKDIFGTSFAIDKITALPDFGGSLGFGKTFNIGDNQLSILASLGANKETEVINNAYITTLTANGTELNSFDYESYSSKLKIAGLASVGYRFRKEDRINYTMFYARNAVDNYMQREGFDSEGVNLVGSNSVFHAYSLLNNQLLGHHVFGKKLSVDWSGSYGTTTSNEPDRRQVMFRKDNDNLSLFKLNQQETMRYFGNLDETEWVGDLKLTYKFGEKNKIRVGGTYKDKSRDFQSTRFYYDVHGINPTINDIYNTNDYLNQANVANGAIRINMDNQPKDSYFAGSSVYAGFAEIDYYPIESVLINLGVRYENSNQWVKYWNDASIQKRSELNTPDLFPALNIKYNINEQNNLRLSLSKTVTRPSFIEMSPFLYKEAYGKAEIRGNENLQNGYNYNVDLRYEYFPKNSNDMFAVTAYYKKLDSPIERVQQSSGGSAVHSFRNSEEGMAAGLEIEMRKELFKDFRVGINGSYMYTNVKLPEGGGIYTETERSLQGASPYLGNADVSYAPRFGEDKRMVLSLMYNVQGPRIHTVGIYGLGDVKQQVLHTLDFVGKYEFNHHFSVKAQLKNLLNSSVRFVQDVPSKGTTQEVESYNEGMTAQIGFTYKF